MSRAFTINSAAADDVCVSGVCVDVGGSARVRDGVAAVLGIRLAACHGGCNHYCYCNTMHRARVTLTDEGAAPHAAASSAGGRLPAALS